jgi:hypothetical protein
MCRSRTEEKARSIAIGSNIKNLEDLAALKLEIQQVQPYLQPEDDTNTDQKSNVDNSSLSPDSAATLYEDVKAQINAKIKLFKEIIKPLNKDVTEIENHCLDYLDHLENETQTYLASLTDDTLQQLENNSDSYTQKNPKTKRITYTRADGILEFSICYEALRDRNPTLEHTTLMMADGINPNNSNNPDTKDEQGSLIHSDKPMDKQLWKKLDNTSALLEAIQTYQNKQQPQNNSDSDIKFDREEFEILMQDIQEKTLPNTPFKKEIAGHRGKLNRFFGTNENTSVGGSFIAKIRAIAMNYPDKPAGLEYSHLCELHK